VRLLNPAGFWPQRVIAVAWASGCGGSVCVNGKIIPRRCFWPFVYCRCTEDSSAGRTNTLFPVAESKCEAASNANTMVHLRAPLTHGPRYNLSCVKFCKADSANICKCHSCCGLRQRFSNAYCSSPHLSSFSHVHSIQCISQAIGLHSNCNADKSRCCQINCYSSFLMKQLFQ
jgi:hypothetical protein